MRGEALNMKLIRWLCGVLVAFSLVGVALSGDADPTRVSVHIEEQPLGQALNQLARQTGLQVLRRDEDASTDGLISPRLIGEWSAEEALIRLLAGTNLKYEFVNSRTVRIWAAPRPLPAKSTATMFLSGDRVQLAQSDSVAPSGAGAVERQAATGPDRDMERSSFEQIIVTAQRREQSLQDVPISVTALNEETLKAMGAYQFADFAASVPGLTMSDNGANHANFIIRGVTSDITGGALQSTVALYIDDLPSMDTYASLSTPDLHLFDVSRVEVLRGPQGTLFGSGAMGGAIRVITNQPNMNQTAFGADVGTSSTDGGTGSYNLNGMLNVPLVPGKLAMRVVGYLQDSGGWVNNTVLGNNRNDVKAYGGRLIMKYDPTEHLTLTGTLTFQSSQPEDNSYYTGMADGEPVRSLPQPEFVDDRFTISNLVVEYDFGKVMLRSSTSFAQKTVVQQQDMTASSQGILGPDTPPSNINWHDSSDNFFQELHLYSTGDNRLNWFVGAYFRDQSNRYYDFHWIIPGSEETFGTGPAGAPGDDVYHYLDQSGTKEKALFGELYWKVTDKLRATVGVRRFRNSYDNVNSVSGVFAGGASTTDLGSNDNKSTYRFVLDYRLNPNAMLYAQASEGYRVGGANAPAPDPTPPQFGPDQLWSYEVGAKTTFLGGRLRLNGALYYIDWKDMQLTQYTENGWLYVSNVGNTRSSGAELEIQADIGEHFQYTGAIATNDARIEVDNAAIGAESGDRVPGVPHFTMSNALEYKAPLFANADGYVRIDHHYVGGSYSIFDSASALHMGDYHLLNLRVGADFGHWDMSLYANNLFNCDEVSTAIYANRVYRTRPLTFGLNARVKF